MYTVMLVTDQARVLANFERFERWEELGYTRPLLFTSAGDALAALTTRTVHAVSIDVPPGESAALYDRLHGMSMFFLEPVAESDALAVVLERMTRMIEARNASVAGAQTPLMRETFFQTLLDGLMHSQSVMRNRLTLLGLPGAADSPCLLITLRMINGEEYLREIWRYGRARLTMALRKFLQSQADQNASDGIAYTLSGLRAGTMRLLACPLTPMSSEPLREHAMGYITDQINRVEEFLELELSVDAVEELDGLKALLHNSVHD
ncbi:MAG: hypothetical protein LBK46_04430 [Oscillospiraceae bacterium]|jgi:hypothetical protein|nr:hypothetical protein [Oscillospiraceae bacterium]